MAIIAISGKIGSGKDTVGRIINYFTSKVDNPTIEYIDYCEALDLSDKYIGKFEIKKFADKLKDIVCLLIGCTKEQLEDNTFKETALREEWWYFKDTINGKEALIPFHDNNSRWTGIANLVKLTPRLLFQLLGTECGRNIIHPNIWINSLFVDYKEQFISGGIGMFHDPRPKYKSIGFPNWIITDTRFPNELQAVKDKGGISIRVNRKQFVEYSGQIVEAFNVHPSETALDNAEFDYVIDNNGSIEELIEKVKEILIKEKII